MSASVYRPLCPLPSSDAEIQDFIDREELVKPLSFARTDAFSRFLSFQAWIAAVGSMGVSCLCPVVLFKPGRVAQHYALKLDSESVIFDSAFNDCCCHIAVSQQTIPLDKIQDIQIQSGCLQTCFGLKEVRVQTAGVNQAGTPDISTAFLASPEQARKAIQLAVRLCKRRGLSSSPPGPEGDMNRGTGGESLGACGHRSMQDRLQRLALLVQRGTLTVSEGDRLRVKVLAAEQDLTARLFEAESLRSRELLSEQEFIELRLALLEQLQ